MTREEQILNKAIDYSEIEENFLEYDDCGDVCDDKTFIEKAFIEGAKWADEHPNLIDEELEMMWQKKHLIDKACMWLSLNMADIAYFGMNGDLYKPEFIQNFKKAMEE